MKENKHIERLSELANQTMALQLEITRLKYAPSMIRPAEEALAKTKLKPGSDTFELLKHWTSPLRNIEAASNELALNNLKKRAVQTKNDYCREFVLSHQSKGSTLKTEEIISIANTLYKNTFTNAQAIFTETYAATNTLETSIHRANEFFTVNFKQSLQQYMGHLISPTSILTAQDSPEVTQTDRPPIVKK